jgi:hypothetical protein
MPRTGFYNDNANRNYPFTPDSTLVLSSGGKLPSSIVVDFGCILGHGNGFVDGTHQVILESIARDGTQYTFTFTCAASSLRSRPLAFTRTITDIEYTEEFVESTIFTSGDAGACGIDSPAWEGFLVTGDLTALSGVIPNNVTVTVVAGGCVLEPARIQNIDQSFIQTLNLANAQRLRTEPTPACATTGTASNDDLIPTPGTPIVNSTCNIGAIILQEGYNCYITQNSAANKISINAIAGAGKGDPCNDEVPRYPGELIPSNSTLYTGGPACSDLIRSINGITGNIIRLTSGYGVSITMPPDQPHTLVVDVSLRDLTICEPTPIDIGNPSPGAPGGQPPGGTGAAGNIPSEEVVPSPTLGVCPDEYPNLCIGVGSIDDSAVGTPLFGITPLGIDDSDVPRPSVDIVDAVNIRPENIDSPADPVPTPVIALGAVTITFPGIDAPDPSVPNPVISHQFIQPAAIDAPTPPAVPSPLVTITGVDARRPMYYYRNQRNSANLLAQRRVAVVQFGPFINPVNSPNPLTSLSLTVELSKDGGETFIPRNSSVTPTHESEGWYQVYLDKCDTSEVGPLVVRATGGNGAFIPVWGEFLVVGDDYFDAKRAVNTCT